MIDPYLLKRCLDEGMSLPEIAKLIGTSPGTVGYWVTRHGLTANGSTKFRPGKGLKRSALEKLVLEGLTLGQVASRLSVSISCVRYWIEKHGLPAPREVRAADADSRRRSGDTRMVRTCRHHGEAEFVLDERGWRCRRCRREAVSRRRRKVKRLLVEEAGGECSICGYDRSVAALQFHHLDPSVKRFGLSRNGHTVALAVAREEAAKCMLLCANCHAEVEAGVTDLPTPSLRR